MSQAGDGSILFPINKFCRALMVALPIGRVLIGPYRKMTWMAIMMVMGTEEGRRSENPNSTGSGRREYKRNRESQSGERDPWDSEDAVASSRPTSAIDSNVNPAPTQPKHLARWFWGVLKFTPKAKRGRFVQSVSFPCHQFPWQPPGMDSGQNSHV